MNEKNKDGFKIIGASTDLKNKYQAWMQHQEVPSCALSALKASIHKKTSNKKRMPKNATLIVWKKPKLSNTNKNNSLPPFRISPMGSNSLFHCETAWDIFSRQTTSNNTINITCCNKEIDNLLGGGVELGKITEFCGLSGTGKTQIGLQLACDVQVPTVLNGIGGQCIYIDTANGVFGERLFNVCKSFIHHIHDMARKREIINSVIYDLGSERDMMSNILIFRCFSFKELDFILMKLLDEILSGNSQTYSSKFHNVKLIVIDPISFLIKYQENLVQYICKLGQLFHYLCKKYNVAIVCMNQMTTKMSVGSKEKQFKNKKSNKNDKNFYDDDGNFDQIPLDAKYVIVPGLGFVWTSIVNYRIQTLMIDEIRYAKLLKTCKNIKTNQSAKFKISTGGVRNFKTNKKR